MVQKNRRLHNTASNGCATLRMCQHRVGNSGNRVDFSPDDPRDCTWDGLRIRHKLRILAFRMGGVGCYGVYTTVGWQVTTTELPLGSWYGLSYQRRCVLARGWCDGSQRPRGQTNAGDCRQLAAAAAGNRFKLIGTTVHSRTAKFRKVHGFL